MKSSFFIVADRGALKAFRAEKSAADRPPRLTMVQAVEFAQAHQKISEMNTDMAGAFPKGSTFAGSNGGRHQNSTAEKHYDIELDRRSARQLGTLISNILRQEHPASWSFAAPSDFKDQVLGEIDQEFQQKLAEYVPRDLVNVAHTDLLSHFSDVRAA